MMEIIDSFYQEMGDEPFVGLYKMRTPELLIKDPELVGKDKQNIFIYHCLSYNKKL